MLNLKKTALAVIALGSTAAFAGTMGPVCSAVNVTVPCENTAWDLGGRALYLQPSSNAGALGSTTLTSNGQSVSVGSNPQWAWGFQLEGSYHYSTGNDFNLNWYHFRGSDSKAFTGPVTFTNLATTTGQVYDSFTLDSATVTGDSSWDQVNMEFGQHVDFGENKFARFHGGMNFSRVGYNSTFASSVTATSTAATGSVTVLTPVNNTTSSVYNGFGPRVGTDLNYDWGNGLSVYADGALSVLAGTSKASTGIIATDNSLIAGTQYTGTIARSASNVVGELDAKLGAMYTYAMAQGDLSLDIGWVFANYVSALKDTSDADSSFGIQGLYFGLKWVGNVA